MIPGCEKCACPHCGLALDLLAFKLPVAPGDITICANCAKAVIHNEDLTVRKMTNTEVDALPDDQVVRVVSVMIALHNKEDAH